MNQPLTIQQVFEYESGSKTFVQSFLILWFPKYFIWVVQRRYKRYTHFMLLHEQIRIQKEFGSNKLKIQPA